ncbi:hypothetical protein FRC06_009751, partial [Ceratobasidium sp. 370]
KGGAITSGPQPSALERITTRSHKKEVQASLTAVPEATQSMFASLQSRLNCAQPGHGCCWIDPKTHPL